jgi:hypothetical protein
MNDRVVPIGTVDGSPETTVVFDRPRTSLVLGVLASFLAAALVGVSALDLDLSQWLILTDQGLRGPILQDLLGRINGGTVAVVVAGLLALAYERYLYYRREPQRVEIAGDQLRIQLSCQRTASLALPLVREVQAKGSRFLDPGYELTLQLAGGELHEFKWERRAHEKLVEALKKALLLQPVPGDRSGTLLRPLLHPGLPVVEIAPGDRRCPRCEQVYPSEHWFVVHGPSQEVICRSCAEALDLERAEALLGADRREAATLSSS